MDLDVLYVTKNIRENIKRFVRRESIQTAFYKAQDNKYENKKTIFNALWTLKDSGFLVVECSINNISEIYNLLEEYGRQIIFFNNFLKNISIPYVVAGKQVVENPVKLLSSEEKDIDTEIVLSYSNTGDCILALGEKMVNISYLSKRLCRYAICITDKPHNDEYEGLSHVYVEE